ncbi:transposase [Alicyclobacillus mengziensis]|uniref:Transposase n=1 Tax=Alicyclobacillus mengziensis TaxID=2931921 RepID=A0A9X7Z8P1_9BACL|nr:transposase [Alicyclobacillus mengziensis]QSO48083.1 transposase [Alicyclobacillus mengziensis]QSO48543.1 transposase [Alicyclobacillus mengziensis]
MLREHIRQLSFADTDGWYKKIPTKSFWYRIRAWADENLQDSMFAHMYSGMGRPSVPPTYMTVLTIIQMREGWSDGQAVESAMFDDRVKYALGVGRAPEITCDRSTLCKFRARALENGLDRDILKQSLLGAASAGLLAEDEDLVDSYMVSGAAAKQGTFLLIHQAIGSVLRQAVRERVTVPSLHRTDYLIRRKPDIDWADEGLRNRLLQELVMDSRTLTTDLTAQPGLSEELKQKLDLLRTVAEQDIETSPDGTVHIVQGVAKDRVISVVDEEMRHGHKTTSATTDGYKTHLMTPNVTADQPRLVTSLVVTGANVPDGDVLDELVTERIALTGATPKQVMGDTAYGSEAVQERVSQVSEETSVVAPVPPVVNKAGHFNKSDFVIDTDVHTVTCPAGHTVSYVPKKPRVNTRLDQVVFMDESKCKDCLLRSQCVNGKGPRSIRIRADEKKIQEKRAKQETPEWNAHYRERSRVEHVNESMIRHGGRKTRYFGKRKTEFQERMCATGHNIDELARATALRESSAREREKCA